jgi:hypothetical protein
MFKVIDVLVMNRLLFSCRSVRKKLQKNSLIIIIFMPLAIFVYTRDRVYELI